jgi:uncharacterized protein YhdP
MIEQLNIDKGRIRLEDSLTLPGQKLVYTLTDVTIDANNLAPGQKMAFQIALRDEAKPGMGSLKGQGTFTGLTEALTVEDPQLNLSLTLIDLDVDTLEPYLKNEAHAKLLDGRISLDVNYQGDFGQHLSAEGQLDLTHFTYTDPSMWEKPLPGAETKVTYQLMLDPEQVKIEKLEVNLGEISVSAEGLLRDWRKEPIIKNGEISSDFTLVELIPLVPWGQLGEEADIIRQTLTGGGRVTIEKIVLPELVLTKLPAEPKDLLSRVKAWIKVSNLSVGLSPQLPDLEDITGNFRLEKGVLNATNVQARLGPLTLPTLEARATNLTGKPKVSAAARGPMKIARTKNADVEKLLRQNGLKSFAGSVEVDLRADYDQAKPQQWGASGSLILEGVSAVSHPAGVRLGDLNGKVILKRKKTLDVTVENLTARVNQAPIELAGKVSGGGSPRLVVDAKARTERLNLAHLTNLFRPLKDLKLGGTLDMDIAVHYPHAQPKKSRIDGEVKARGLGMRLTPQNITVKDGNADIELAGNSVKIDDMTLRANDQKISVTGQVTNFEKPTARLQVNSPNLNLDRLLPTTQQEQAPTKTTPERPAKKKAGKKELPPFLRDLTAQIQAEAKLGQYRRQQFQDLKFAGQYERGVLKSHEFDIRLAGGRIQTKGSADLRNLERIRFSVQPAITAVHLESLAPLLGTKKLTVDGPLTLTGRLQGSTGSTLSLLRSLGGHLEAAAGPGHIHKLGKAGDALFKVLTVLNVESMLSGKTEEDLATKGVPYTSITAKTSFQAGNMNIGQLLLNSPALGLDGNGDINLVKERLNMEADIQVLGSVDKILNILPIVGKTGVDLTRMYVTLEGNLEDPKIRVRPARGAKDAEKQEVDEGEKAVGDVFKGIDKLIGK